MEKRKLEAMVTKFLEKFAIIMFKKIEKFVGVYLCIFMDVSQTLEIAIHVLKSALSYHLLYGTYIMYQSSVVVTSVVTSPVKS